MARFYPLYVRRSDGKIEIIVKGKRKELNQPTDEQLDQKPDKNGVSDYYREVASDEPKHIDWRRKLGGLLAREMDWNGKQSSNGMYVTCPLAARSICVLILSRKWLYAGRFPRELPLV
jgi:hypothetical protein